MVDGVQGEADGGTTGSVEFLPQGLVDGPGDVWVSGAEFAEAGEGEVVLDGDRQGVFLGELEGGEEVVVCFADCRQQLGRVVGLQVGVGAVGGGLVGCVPDDEFLACGFRLVSIAQPLPMSHIDWGNQWVVYLRECE